MISRRANFTTSTTQDYYQAHQQPRQSFISFDIYLSILKSVIESKTDSTLIIEFFICLDPTLRDRIEISSRDMLSTNHQEMVAFVQCVWYNIVQTGEVK
jgi:hypothetical protein